MDLSKYIKEILISKDNVIIPNFGAFEKSMASAKIDEKTGKMHPPQITVIFRPELKSDSGVLVKHIAGKENISEDKVTEEIKGQVANWENSLNSGKKVIFVGLGMIFKGSSGALGFEPTINPSDFPDSYGLPVLDVQEKSGLTKKIPEKKVETKKPTKGQKKVPEKKPIRRRPPVKVKRTAENGEKKKGKKGLVIALIFLIPIAALVVLGFIFPDFAKQKFNDTSNFVSGLVSNNKPDTSNVEPVVIDTLSSVDSSRIETEEILENYTIINSETNTKVEPKIEEFTEVKKVHIIAGSFKVKSFARRHRNKLNKKGFTAELLPANNGLYRVSVASFDNIENAANDFERIKTIDENLNVWILVDK